MKKQLFSNDEAGQPFRLSVTSSDEEPTKVRLWFADAEGKEHLRVEISGGADLVRDLNNHVLASPVIQALIREANPDSSIVAKILGEAEEALRAASGD